MKLTFRITSFFLLALLVFLPARSAAASGGSFEGQLVFGRSYILESGESLNGDLLVFGGTAVLQQGSTVNGDVVVLGSSLVVNGQVNGDVAVTGGSLVMGATAHITGSLSTVGVSLQRAEGSRVDGAINDTATSWVGVGQNGGNPVTPIQPVLPNLPLNFNFDPIGPMLNAFGQAIGLAVLAMLVMLFLAQNADRVAHAVILQPLVAGGLGLLTAIAGPFVLVLMVITIILIPVTPILVIALVVAAVFGWIAIGYEIGQRFTRAIHQEWHPAFSAGLGVFALTLVANALSGIPVVNCFGWLVPFVLGLAGLGAVIMTRFGTQAVAPRESTGTMPQPPVLPVEPASPMPALPPVAVEPVKPKRSPKKAN